MLSKEQQDHYHRQGYLVVENAISDDDIASLKAAALEIVDNFDIEHNRTTFSTSDRDSGRDDYFFESAGMTEIMAYQNTNLSNPVIVD